MTHQPDPEPTTPVNPFANLSLADFLKFAQPAPKPPVMPSDPGLPTDLLPAPIETWLHDTATIAGVLPVMTTMPYLAGTGAVIGNRLGLRLQPGWTEFPLLWVALVTLTGGGKTPALLAARQPFNILHEEELARAREADTPAIPLIITRGHWRQLQQLLPHANGLLLPRDELLGLIRTIDRGTGEGRQHYLSLWSGDVLDETTHHIIEHPVVSIVGGIEPLLLFTLRRKQHDGLMERFLPVLAGGPIRPWRHDLPPVPDLEAVLEPLRTLRARPGHSQVTLSPEGQSLWASWYDAQVKLIAGNHLTLCGFYRKYPNHLARLILVMHALWHPHDPTIPVSRDTVDRAITLVEYLRLQLHRSLVLVNQKHPLRSPIEALVTRIERNLAAHKQDEGWMKRSTLYRQLGNAPTALFSAAITQLQESGRIEQRTVKAGRGRPGEQLRLLPQSSFATNPLTPEEINPEKPMESSDSEFLQISSLANQILATALKSADQAHVTADAGEPGADPSPASTDSL